MTINELAMRIKPILEEEVLDIIIYKDGKDWEYDTPTWIEDNNFEDDIYYKMFVSNYPIWTHIGYENCPQYDIDTIKAVIKSGYKTALEQTFQNDFDEIIEIIEIDLLQNLKTYSTSDEYKKNNGINSYQFKIIDSNIVEIVKILSDSKFKCKYLMTSQCGSSYSHTGCYQNYKIAKKLKNIFKIII